MERPLRLLRPEFSASSSVFLGRGDLLLFCTLSTTMTKVTCIHEASHVGAATVVVAYIAWLRGPRYCREASAVHCARVLCLDRCALFPSHQSHSFETHLPSSAERSTDRPWRTSTRKKGCCAAQRDRARACRNTRSHIRIPHLYHYRGSPRACRLRLAAQDVAQANR